MTGLFSADPKTTQVVLYIISHTQPSLLGATKLNKVMWRADVLHYRRFGKTITGQTSYIRMPQGPIPNFVSHAIAELKAANKILERPTETPVGTRREFVWIERLGATEFSAEEVETLHEAIDIVCMMSAGAASDRIHDALWEEFDDGEQVPVRAAAVTIGQLEPEDITWAMEAVNTAAE